MIQTQDWINLISQFRSQMLPKSLWTHEAHLVVALWHLLEYRNINNALCYLRSGIILHNYSVGIPNTESRGYHETITIFWLKEINKFIESQNNSRDFETLVEKLLKNTPFTQKDYILRFYGKEVLKSAEARGFYIPPSYH